MDFENVIGKIGLSCSKELRDGWELSEKTFQPVPFFLDQRFLEDTIPKARIDSSEHGQILDVASKISQNKALSRLVWHQHFLMSADEYRKIEDIFPDRIDALGDDFFTYNLLLSLSVFPTAERLLRRFPPEVLDAVYSDVGIWCAHFRRNLNLCGISPRILGWENGLIHGSLYRIGRLQFNIIPFHSSFIVFRNRTTGKVQALAKDAAVFNSDGQLDGVDNIHDKDAWTSRLLHEPGRISGNILSPLGFVSRKMATLDLSEWEQVLSPEDPVLDVHIPAGSPFTMESCAESFTMAMAFFRKYSPDKPFKGFSCHSWFLDIQYEKILPPKSNILAFQHEFYLYPIMEGGEDSLWRIFGENGLKNGLANAPRSSSMQRAVATFLEQGGKLRSGGGFILLEDLPFGRSYYRKSLENTPEEL